MKVLNPLTITPGMITASDAPESHFAWASGTTYSIGQFAIYGAYIYQSLTNSNTGNNPSTDTTNWVLYAPSNKWAMFDDQVSTRTDAGDTNLVVTVSPGQYFNSIALLNMDAISVTVSVPQVSFNQSYDLNETVISDWYGYFFAPYQLRRDIVVEGIPPSVSATATITITNSSGNTAKVGMVRIGTEVELGDSEYGASLGITDYSVKETDDFGVTTFVERAFSKKLSANVFCQNGALMFITTVLQAVRAKPTVWIYSDRSEFRPAVVYGYARDWNIDIAYTNHSLLSIEIEGLT